MLGRPSVTLYRWDFKAESCNIPSYWWQRERDIMVLARDTFVRNNLKKFVSHVSQIDADDGEWVPVEGDFIFYLFQRGILIKVLDYTILDRQIFNQEWKGWDIFTGGKKLFRSLKVRKVASRRVSKESMAWFPGPKWNEFVLKCKLNVANSKKRKVVGQAKSRQAPMCLPCRRAVTA